MTVRLNGDGLSRNFTAAYGAFNNAIVAAVGRAGSVNFVLYYCLIGGVFKSSANICAAHETSCGIGTGCLVIGVFFTIVYVTFLNNENYGVDHSSKTTGSSGDSYCLGSGGINEDFVVYTVIGRGGKCVFLAIYGKLRGVCLVFCRVNDNLGYIIRNGECKGTGY